MTQILLYSSKDGIALATDSVGVLFGSETEESTGHVEVQKLFPLSQKVLLLTGGAGFGVLLCQRFQRMAAQAGLMEFGEICDTAKPFFTAEVESFRRQSSTSILSQFDRVYFLIAARTDSDESEGSFHFKLLGSENGTDPVHLIETAQVLAIPRQMGMEVRLTKFREKEASLDEVETFFESSLSKLSDADEDIGPPFHFARITLNGIVLRTIEKSS